MRRAAAIGAAVGGGLLFVATGVWLGAAAVEFARLSIVGAAVVALV